MIANYSIEVCDASQSTIGLLEIGKFEGIGMGIGLGIVAGIGLTIKALFVWYIQYRAPKDRPINTLIWHDQVYFITFFGIISLNYLVDIMNICTLISAIPICFGIDLFCHDHCSNLDPDSFIKLCWNQGLLPLLDHPCCTQWAPFCWWIWYGYISTFLSWKSVYRKRAEKDHG